ncbi:keratin-associated protein 6-1-like [Amphibalanus amphitrite]|uniref:keratin-associated protein 6-1-like n=1 Tax=Amphibalanus amphitrite TaxID=1232801 RepID=UPI001C8FE766|nr:keratin-associated protein 6-1-like [Amphibalanus amphitrite]
MKLVILFALVAVAAASYLPYHGSNYYYSRPYYYDNYYSRPYYYDNYYSRPYYYDNYYSPYGRGFQGNFGFNNFGAFGGRFNNFGLGGIGNGLGFGLGYGRGYGGAGIFNNFGLGRVGAFSRGFGLGSGYGNCFYGIC